MNEKIVADLDTIIGYLKKKNFKACCRMSRSLASFSVFLDFDDGIFIGECMHNIFGDLTDLAAEYSLKEDEGDAIMRKGLRFIKCVQKFFSSRERCERVI